VLDNVPGQVLWVARRKGTLPSVFNVFGSCPRRRDRYWNANLSEQGSAKRWLWCRESILYDRLPKPLLAYPGNRRERQLWCEKPGAN